ncbi:hypothetical protein V8E54_008715 [Elaphomyces granulatus]
MPLPIRTAALLGTPSKTLRSGTPEFVRGSRAILYHFRFWLIRKTFSRPTYFRDGEAIPVSIDERPRVSDKNTESIGQGIGLRCPDGNDFGAKVHPLH